MTIDQHLTTFAGRPVVDFVAEEPLPDLAAVALRVKGDDWDDFEAEQLVPVLKSLLATDGADALEVLVLGWWGSVDTTSEPCIAWLTEHAADFPRLTGLFVGDITFEENEMSWINQCDLRPLLAELPALTHLGTRGAGEQTPLVLGPVELPELRSLVVQTGGMGKGLLDQVLGSTLPKLEHLELWLGDESYGAEVGVEDLEPLFGVPPFPLTSLGLCNSELTDAIAARLAGAAVVPQLRRLDLSLGTLGDEGAEALLAGQPLSHLEQLDLHRHFCSPEVVQRLLGLAPVVDVSDPQEADVYDGEAHRYVAVGE